MKLKDFIESTNIPESLVRATVRQCGGWESFQEMAQDVANHGADAGWSGFTYYSDTVPFAKRNKSAIVEYMGTLARDIGEGNALAFMCGFNCLKCESEEDNARALFGRDNGQLTAQYNALAWFALEEVARAFDDWNGR